uniref:Uncharacterized protein n=1 Tax=Anopheles christyi TaxID=43041 RepID=A0A182KHC6_9DIPT
TTNAIRQALKRKLENTAEKAPSSTASSPSSSGSFVTPNHSDASEDESDLPPRKRQYVRNPDQLESHAALQKQLHQLHHKQQQQALLSGSGAPTPPPSEFSGSEDETTKSGSDEERCYFQGAPQRESVIMRINKDGSCTKTPASEAEAGCAGAEGTSGALNIFRSYKFKMGPRMSPPPPTTVSVSPSSNMTSSSSSFSPLPVEVQPHEAESRMVQDLSTTSKTPVPVFTSSSTVTVSGKRKKKESTNSSFSANLSQPILPKVLPSSSNLGSHASLPAIAPKITASPATAPQFILATQNGYIIVPQQMSHNLLVATAAPPSAVSETRPKSQPAATVPTGKDESKAPEQRNQTSVYERREPHSTIIIIN